MEDNFSMKKLPAVVNNGKAKRTPVHHNLKMMKPKGKVLVPKKLGRTNPDFIKTDHFDLAKTLNTINTVASAVQQVSTTVQQVNAAVSTQSNTVKATVTTPPANANPLLNAGYALTAKNAGINNGYNPNTGIIGQMQQPITLQAQPSFSMNTILMIGAAVVVVLVILFTLKKK